MFLYLVNETGFHHVMKGTDLIVFLYLVNEPGFHHVMKGTDLIVFLYLVNETGFHHVMKGTDLLGLEGYENEGYTFLTLMVMSFGEFDVSVRN